MALLTLCLAACGGPAEDAAPSPPAPPARHGTSSRPGFPFTDVTAASGLDFRHRNGAAGRRYFPETMGPGLALFDADGDGDLDLYAVQGAPLPESPDFRAPNRLFLNRGDGTFDDVTAESGAGDTGYGMGVTAGDFDGDGRLDLYVLNYGPNVLLRNLGNGRFEAVTAGVEDAGWSVGGAFLDYDGDGDLDLFVVNYLLYEAGREAPCTAGTLRIYCSPEPFPPAPDHLFRNDGAGADGRVTFSDVSRQAGIRPDGRGMGVSVSDLDEDGDPDLYVTNDRSPNQLYRNTGGGFEEVAAESGVGYGSGGEVEGGMGSVAGDFSGTGRPALFVTNFQKEPNRLYVAAGGGFFDDRTLVSGVGLRTREKVSWGLAALDVEGDGDLDVAVANGHVYDNAAEFIAGSSYAMPDHLFVNRGDGSFETEEFPGPALSSRGVAAGDLDGDGDPDLVILSCADRLRVWRNDRGRPEDFLVILLADAGPNTHAYGALLTGRIGERRLRREVAGGGGYLSHSDVRVYLGLGDEGAVEDLTVRWPGGEEERLERVEGGQEIVWQRGAGIVERRALE